MHSPELDDVIERSVAAIHSHARQQFAHASAADHHQVHDLVEPQREHRQQRQRAHPRIHRQKKKKPGSRMVCEPGFHIRALLFGGLFAFVFALRAALSGVLRGAWRVRRRASPARSPPVRSWPARRHRPCGSPAGRCACSRRCAGRTACPAYRTASSPRPGSRRNAAACRRVCSVSRLASVIIFSTSGLTALALGTVVMTRSCSMTLVTRLRSSALRRADVPLEFVSGYSVSHASPYSGELLGPGLRRSGVIVRSDRRATGGGGATSRPCASIFMPKRQAHVAPESP